jgi:hypothetical protein
MFFGIVCYAVAYAKIWLLVILVLVVWLVCCWAMIALQNKKAERAAQILA